MGKSLWTELLRFRKPFLTTEYIGQWIATLLLGVGGFRTVLTSFSLEYDIRSWHSGNVSKGFLGVMNALADIFGRASFTLLSKYDRGTEDYGLFLTIIVVILLLISYLIVRSEIRWLLLLYFIPIIVLSVGYNIQPSADSVILLAFGAAIMLVLTDASDWNRRNSIIIICILALASLLPSILGVGTGFWTTPAAVKTTGTLLKDAITDVRYGEDVIGGGTLVSDASIESDKTALVITMEDPQAMYFRGFVGESYGNSGWTTLTDSKHYEMQELTTALHSAGFTGLSQLTTSAELGGITLNSQSITVETKVATRRYVYLPYEYMEGLNTGFRNYSDSFATGTGLRGTSTISFTGGQNLTGRWTNIAGMFYSSEPTDSIRSYEVAESYYNVQVYENYTELDDDTIEALAEEIGSRGNQEKGHVDYKTAISNVQGYFDSNIIEASSIKESDDPLQSLFQLHKANELTAASAATLMFRYYGIPARYVEGYLLTSERANAASANSEIEIPMSDAHAWTEIYIDGIGWVPIEVLESGRQHMPQADMTKGLETDSWTNPFNQPENVSENVVVEEENNPATAFPWHKVGLVLVILLIVLIGGVAGRKGWRLLQDYRKRKRDFNQKDVRRAICAMYEYANNKKWTLPDHLRRISMEAAYSNHLVDEEDRKEFRRFLNEARKNS